MSRAGRPPHAGLSVDGVLGPGGALSGALGGYENRPQQLAMARAVEAALAQGRHLVAEAGTGTGKTLAYLVPAALSGRRVVVSTATRTLQEQIFFKDLPLLRDAVGLPFSAALLKGRANYLCLARFAHFSRRPLFPTPEDATHWPALRAWAEATRTGDRGETALPDAWGPWPLVSTTADSCLGGQCAEHESCFVTRARRRAEECDVVVVNHALYFADLALRARGGDFALGVLPPHDAVIFDEAHALEDVATEHFGLSVSWARVAALSQDALAAYPPADPRAAALTALALTLKARADRFFADTAAALGLADGADARLTPASLERVHELASALLETLGALSAACPTEDEDLASLRRRAAETAQALEAIVRADDAAQVYWAQAKGRGVTLRAAPIDVGETLARHLYGGLSAAVFTSATLAVGRSRPGARDEEAFAWAAARFGLGAARWDALAVDSPFDYQAQAALYAPTHLPEPNEPGWTPAFAEEVERLVRLTQGRAFVLFTSLRHMDAVHALLAPRLSVPALKQGERPRRALLEAFTARPSVLFASQSFWEGVDVPGPALSLVVIDRLPFAPPGEPLQAARIEALRARGENPFDGYQLPQAALALRQGFGRLIRTRQDRGIVALGDARVHRKRYGRVFLDSLPPARRFGAFDDVAAWWG